jgi:hypothetical protein
MVKIEERAKMYARIFNALDMGNGVQAKDIKRFLMLNRIAYRDVITNVKYRDNFFDIKRVKGGGIKDYTFYCKKKEPIHFSKFVELIRIGRNSFSSHKKEVTPQMMREAVSKLDGLTETCSYATCDEYAGFTVEKCVAFLKKNGYVGLIEKTVKTEIEI